MTQLERLARPFPDRLIHNNPSGGGSYVKHSVVTEKLLAVVGPFDFELVEIIRGHVEGTAPNPSGKSDRAKRGTPGLDGVIVGAVCRLTVEIDTRRVSVEEVGDCEQPHNWPHDGARLKDAMSDALKRCAMRIGVTLHLWSGPEFSLYDLLHKNAGVDRTAGANALPVGTVGESGEPLTERLVTAAPAIPKHRRETLKSRCVAVSEDYRASGRATIVADEREKLGLPLVDSCNPEQFAEFEAMVTRLELALSEPFGDVALSGSEL